MCEAATWLYWGGFLFFVYAGWHDRKAFKRWHKTADAYEIKLRELIEREERGW